MCVVCGDRRGSQLSFTMSRNDFGPNPSVLYVPLTVFVAVGIMNAVIKNK